MSFVFLLVPMMNWGISYAYFLALIVYVEKTLPVFPQFSVFRPVHYISPQMAHFPGSQETYPMVNPVKYYEALLNKPVSNSLYELCLNNLPGYDILNASLNFGSFGYLAM